MESQQTELVLLDREVSYKEMLTRYLNIFKDKLIANTLDLRHYELIGVDDPNFEKADQYGRVMKVGDLMQTNRDGMKYAKRNIACIEELIAAADKGEVELAKFWSDDITNKNPLAEILKPKPAKIIKP